MTDADTRERLETLQGDPEALWSWIEALIEQGAARLPEVARWAAERGDVELLMLLMDDYVVSSHLRTVEVIREARPTLGEAITAHVRAMLDHDERIERATQSQQIFRRGWMPLAQCQARGQSASRSHTVLQIPGQSMSPAHDEVARQTDPARQPTTPSGAASQPAPAARHPVSASVRSPQHARSRGTRRERGWFAAHSASAALRRDEETGRVSDFGSACALGPRSSGALGGLPLAAPWRPPPANPVRCGGRPDPDTLCRPWLFRGGV